MIGRKNEQELLQEAVEKDCDNGGTIPMMDGADPLSRLAYNWRFFSKFAP